MSPHDTRTAPYGLGTTAPSDVINVSVIVPAYNERATILEILRTVRAQTVDGFAFEVIVIDDGSTDGTTQILQDNPDLYTRLIVLERNQGKGAAVIAGLKAAGGSYILFQDADLEYDPADYAVLLRPVQKFAADIVIGSRFLAPSFTRVHYFWHKLGNRLITLFFNVLYNTTFTDIYSCYLVYRRALVDPSRLVALGWDQHAEILATAVKKGEIVYETPITYHGRSYSEGKKIKSHHVIAVVARIFRERFSS
jgi:glycosyltransferase involved in cell wall biosynthesis